jgi:hypothetical protein
MRKLLIALGAVAFALSAAALPAAAQMKKEPVAKKKVVKKAAPKKEAVVKYKRKCKAGETWNASATISAGACQKKVAKAKSKAVKAKKA